MCVRRPEALSCSSLIPGGFTATGLESVYPETAFCPVRRYFLDSATAVKAFFSGCGATGYVSRITFRQISRSSPSVFTARLQSPFQTISGVGSSSEGMLRTALKKYACEFTLDPDSAFIHMVLSEGNRKVSQMAESQPHPYHPDRFTMWGQILSREALPTRCYWECEWVGEAVGIVVAYKSINRHGTDSRFGYNKKSWYLQYYQDKFSVLYNHQDIGISVTASGSRRAGVYLDREAGTVSFYSVSSDTDTLTHLYTFHTTFTDEPLHAGLLLYEGLTVTLL